MSAKDLKKIKKVEEVIVADDINKSTQEWQVKQFLYHLTKYGYVQIKKINEDGSV